MTDARTVKIYANKIKLRSICLALSGLAAFTIFFIEAPVIIERMRSGLSLCATVIIPSLFPYMALSELLVFSGVNKLFEGLFGGVFEKIFRIPKCATSAFILGVLCGFPVGAKVSYSLYKQGKINNDDLFHLLIFCNIQSSAFIINTVGISLLGSKNAGAFLYLSILISIIIVGMLYPKFFKQKGSFQNLGSHDQNEKRQGLGATLTSSVKSSVLSILVVCGFVLFFYVICGIIIDLGEKLGIPSVVSLLICSILEISCGCVEVASALPQNAAFLACAMILGFSGISLHFQIASMCPDAEIKYGRFFTFKILTAIISGICAFALNFIFNIFV